MADGEICRRRRGKKAEADGGESSRLKVELKEIKGQKAAMEQEMFEMKAQFKSRLEEKGKASVEAYLKSPDHAIALKEHAGRWVVRAAKYCRKICRRLYKAKDVRPLASMKIFEKVERSIAEGRIICSDGELSSDEGFGEPSPPEDNSIRQTGGGYGRRSPSPDEDD
jgi:hypothetical protein